MLTCDDVQERVPGMETGETAPGEMRDHLASCRACRSHQERVQAELEAMRRELAALAPSPFLADAVLEAAREQVEASARSRVGTRTGAAVGVLLAALLLSVFLLGRGDPGGRPPGGGDIFESGEGQSRLQMPFTAAQVRAARRANRAGPQKALAGAASNEYLHLGLVAPDVQYDTEKGAMLRPREQERQRWVVRADDPRPADRAYGMIGAPPDGVAVLGRTFIEYVGSTVGAEPSRRTEAGLAQLEELGRYVDVVVRPPIGGRTARIRAQINPLYAGSLLLEEPLARALGLNQFEIPGACVVGGDLAEPVQRAWARLRLEALDLEQLFVVQVRGQDGPQVATPVLAGGLSDLMRVSFDGERPSRAFAAAEVRLQANGTLAIKRGVRMAHFPDSGSERTIEVAHAGRVEIGLSYAPGRHPACVVLLPPVSVGAGGPLAWRYTLTRVTLKGKYPPGARATIARVWDGRTAIPSRESVAVTQVAEDGTLSFVRTRGEIGPLRARLVTQEGIVSSHGIRVEEIAPTLSVAIGADGGVVIGEKGIGTLKRREDTGLWILEPGVRQALRAALEHASRAAGWTAGPSPLRVRVRGGPDSPWLGVHALLIDGAAVGISDYRFLLDGDTAQVPVRLPVDVGLAGGAAMEEIEDFEPRPEGEEKRRRDRRVTVQRLKVDLVHPGRGTEFGFKSGSALVSGSVPRDLEVLKGAMQARIAAAGPTIGRTTGTIRFLGERRDAILYRDVRAVVALLHEVGVSQVRLQGRVLPGN